MGLRRRLTAASTLSRLRLATGLRRVNVVAMTNERAAELVAKLRELEPRHRVIRQGFEGEGPSPIDLLFAGLHGRMSEDDADFFQRYENTRSALRDHYRQEESVVTADPHARQFIIELLNEPTKIDFEDLPVSEWMELEQKLLWDRIPSEYFIRNFLASRPAVVLGELPPELNEMIEEARMAYAIGLPRATMSLCRTIIEFAVTDIGERRGLFDRPVTADDFYDEYPPKRRRDQVLGTGGSLRTRFIAIYSECSAVIHGRCSAARSVLDVLLESVELVEKIYAKNHRQLPNREASNRD